MSPIAKLVTRARAAQQSWSTATQAEIDQVVRGIGRTVMDNAEELARLTVEETGLGNYEYNLKQDKRKPVIIWAELKGKKSVGVIRRDEEAGVLEIAKPIGVVGAVLPVTIPVTNFMSNCMFGLKCRNAVIGAPHPRAKRTTRATLALFHEVLQENGAPLDLVQCIDEPSIEATGELMRQVDVVVATGGMGMVKAAYSSGTPAYGVGPGNVQCVVDRDMNVDETVEKIIEGRVFNNGLPCACEQAIIVHSEEAGAYRHAFQERDVAFIEDDSLIDRLQDFLYVDGNLSREGVGITAVQAAAAAGIEVPSGTRMLLLKGDLDSSRECLRKEKLCPISLFYAYDRFDEAIAISKANIALDGKGHTVSIHSDDKAKVEQFAEAMDVSRVVVNDCATTSAGGSFFNQFGATTTLGTGFWGNNSLRENLSYRHLMNITRVGYIPADARIPTDEEIWGD
jgi:succinate-semialdehyde dehydrogenase